MDLDIERKGEQLFAPTATIVGWAMQTNFVVENNLMLPTTINNQQSTINR
ncbi:MAG: hypothetical protein AAGF83_04010 [Cyanobacteria bacterium P01_G01_bin.67]